MDYTEFLKNTEDFVFAENKPEKADIIFVPGNGFPEMAEKAASLYKEGYALMFCQADDTVSHWENLWAYSRRKNFMMEITRRNGNS